jgi:hypothetical protein
MLPVTCFTLQLCKDGHRVTGVKPGFWKLKVKADKARVFRRDSPPMRSRRSTGNGRESSSMLTSVERRLLALKANE